MYPARMARSPQPNPIIAFPFDGAGGVDGLDEARLVTVSPDGAHVYVAGAGDDAVAVFSRDIATGALGFVGSVDGLAGARSVSVSPNGAHVYVASSDSMFDHRVAVFTVNPPLPTVTRVNSVANTGDFQLTEDEQTGAAITQLLVTFGKPVQDPAGDTDPDDVTNPANYRLFTDGVDGVFDSLACGVAEGDDGSITIDAVTYDAATRTATLSVNDGVALAFDAYRLIVCGSTIKDLDGNQLDGNVDGVGGDDFVRNFTVQPPVNQARAANNDSATTEQDVAVIINVPANDTDPDIGDTLTVSSMTQPAHGSVVNNNIDVTYTPNNGFTGNICSPISPLTTRMCLTARR